MDARGPLHTCHDSATTTALWATTCVTGAVGDDHRASLPSSLRRLLGGGKRGGRAARGGWTRQPQHHVVLPVGLRWCAGRRRRRVPRPLGGARGGPGWRPHWPPEAVVWPIRSRSELAPPAAGGARPAAHPPGRGRRTARSTTRGGPPPVQERCDGRAGRATGGEGNGTTRGRRRRPQATQTCYGSSDDGNSGRQRGVRLSNETGGGGVVRAGGGDTPAGRQVPVRSGSDAVQRMSRMALRRCQGGDARKGSQCQRPCTLGQQGRRRVAWGRRHKDGGPDAPMPCRPPDTPSAPGRVAAIPRDGSGSRDGGGLQEDPTATPPPPVHPLR